MTNSWWLYLLLCQGNKTYTGTTTDVERRFQKHFLGTGARFTRINRPIKILAAQPFSDRSTACKAEYQLKQRSQQEKLVWAQQWVWDVVEEQKQESPTQPRARPADSKGSG